MTHTISSQMKVWHAFARRKIGMKERDLQLAPGREEFNETYSHHVKRQVAERKVDHSMSRAEMLELETTLVRDWLTNNKSKRVWGR